MTKEEIISRLGKNAKAVKLINQPLGVDRALFYMPVGEKQELNNMFMSLVSLYADGEKIGWAELNKRECQQSHIRLSRVEINGKRYEIVEDLSYRPGKTRPTYSVAEEGHGSVQEETVKLSTDNPERYSFEEPVYALLTECYTALKSLVEGKIEYDPEVNPASFEWMVSRGHLTE